MKDTTVGVGETVGTEDNQSPSSSSPSRTNTKTRIFFSPSLHFAPADEQRMRVCRGFYKVRLIHPISFTRCDRWRWISRPQRPSVPCFANYQVTSTSQTHNKLRTPPSHNGTRFRLISADALR